MAGFYDIFDATNKKKKKKNQDNLIPTKIDVSNKTNATKNTSANVETKSSANMSPLKSTNTNTSPLKKVEATPKKTSQVIIHSRDEYEPSTSSRPTLMTPGEITSKSNIKKQQESIQKGREIAAQKPQSDENFFGTVGNALKIFGQGAMKAEEGMFIDMPLGISAATGDIATKILSKGVGLFSDSAANRILEFGSNYTNKLNSIAAQDWTANALDFYGWNKKLANGKTVAETMEDSSIIKQSNLGGKVVEGIGGMTPSILMGGAATDFAGLTANGAATGGASTLTAAKIKSLQSAVSYTSLGARSYGGAYEEAINNGGTTQQANAYGLLNAATEIGTEWMSGGVPGLKGTAGTGLDGLFEKYVLKEGLEETSKSLGKAIVKGLYKKGMEGVEEMVSEFISPFIKQFTYQYDENGTLKDNFKNAVNNLSLTDIIQAGIVGSFTSFFLDGVNINDMRAGIQNQTQLSNTIAETINQQENMLGRQLTAEEAADIKNKITEAAKKAGELTPKQTAFTFDEKEARKVKSDKQNVIADDVVKYKLNDEKSNHDLVNLGLAIQSKNDTHQIHIITSEGFYEMGMIKKDANGNYVSLDGSEYIPRGVTTIGNEVYINADVGTQSGTQAMYHELFESFKNSAPSEYKTLKQMVTNIVGEKTINAEVDDYYNRYKDYYKESFKNMTDEQIRNEMRDEIINDKFGELAEDEKFINKICDDRNIFEKFIDSIKDMIRYVKGTEQERQLIKLKKNLETEFAKRYKATDFSKVKNKNTKNVRYSLDKNNYTNEQYEAIQKQIPKYTGMDEKQLDREFTYASDSYSEMIKLSNDLQKEYKELQQTQEWLDALHNYDFESEAWLKGDEYANKIRYYNKEAAKYFAQREAINEVKLSKDVDTRSANQIVKDAEKHFGITNDFKETAYITTNGNQLDFSGHHEGGTKGTRSLDHRQIGEIDTDMDTFIASGNIRVLPESSGINLEIEPNAKQYEKLKAYIEYANDVNHDGIYVDVITGDGSYDSINYNPNTPASKIISDIKTYFKEGAFPKQSELAQFRYSLATNKDNTGRTLTKEQREFFKNSKAVDENGNLQVVYHGTTHPGFNVFKASQGDSQFGKYKFGDVDVNYFTASKDTARGYTEIGIEENGNIYETYLNITNPYTVENTSNAVVKSWKTIKDNNIRQYETDYYNDFEYKWNREKSIKANLDQINEDLFPFNAELRLNEGYYELYDLGKNDGLGESLILYVGEDATTNELFDEGIKEGMYGESFDDYYYTSDRIAKWVLTQNANGENYDGIIIPNIVDTGTKGNMFGEPTTDYITFSSNQIKRVDNTSPTLNEDIRFSLSSTKDSQGRELSKQQQEYFKDSKVVDENGNLKVVYRGSSTEKSYNVFDTDRAGSNGIWFGKGFYFAGELDHALTYAKNNDTSNIYEVYLNLTNPYIMDSDTTNPDGTIEFAPSFYEQIENKFGDYLPTDWKELNSYQKGRAAQNALMDNGYDGVIAGDTYVAYNSNQIKNIDNTNPTSNEDIRYSLAPTQETKDLQTRINESMTMDDMKRILDIAFSESDIEEYSDGAVKTVEEWLNNDDWNYQIPLIAENSFTIIESYLNRIGQFDSGYNEDFTFDDILEAYKNGTLVGHQKATRSDIDTSINTGRIDNRFYAPQFIEATRELYDKANQRVTNSNRNEVYKARADFIIAAHNPGMAEQIGITQQEVNKKLRTWANYPQDAMDISNRVNEGVARENQWSGLENSSIVNYITVSDEQLRSMVKEIRGKSDEYDRKYITSTMLALDTHIDYSSLTFEFGQKDVLKQHHANGDYYAATDTIRVGDAYQNTIAHEMGHYLNSKWARDIFDITDISPLDRPLTHMAIHYNDEVYKLTDSQKQFLNNFTVFVDDLVENAVVDVEGSKSNAEYWQDRDEVFARFVAQFTEWTKNKATNGRFNYESQYHRGFGDSFTQRQYMDFIKILQEKAALEASGDKVQKVRNSLTSNKNIESKEIAPVKTMEETIAPIREDISNISKQMNDLSEQIKTLQNQPEMTSDNEIAPYNPYRARAIAENEANQMMEEIYKDENYWKSVEESAEQVSDLDEKSAKKLSRNIGKELGLKQKQIEDLQKVIQKAFDENYSLQDIKNELDYQFGHQSVSETLQEVIEAQRELRNYKIKVSPEIQKDISDYGYWKQHYFGKIRFSNQGSPVDVAYAELSERNPAMYPRDIWNPTEQLMRIAEVADMDKKYTVDYEMDRNTLDEIANYIHDTFMETLYANAMKQQTDLEEQAMQYNERTKDIPIKKKSRAETTEELQTDMGITADDLQQGNDIKSMSYNLTTPERVNEKVFGREIGRKINEQTVFFAKHQEAERIRFLNKELKEIADLGIKARSKESALVQQYGEGLLDDVQLAQAISDKATQEKIKNAARVLRSKYDIYLDQINEELVNMGYDPIPKRKDYMRHFQELTDKFSMAGIPFNRQALNAENLPTDINGLTEFNAPGKNWFASALQRTGEKTTFDAITGIDGYLQGASNLMYHTETIQRYRALEKLIRDTYGSQHGLDVFGDDLSSEQAMRRITDIQEGKLSNYVAWLHEQANAIAGKKGALDRGVERFFGRRAYTVANELKKQTGSNMTGFNVRSALTNFISSTIAASKTNKLAMVKGTVDTIRNIFNDDGFIDRSDFLTSRLKSDTSISKKTWQKISNAGQILMSGSDWFTSNVITRSKYYEGIQKGMTEDQAMNYANDFAARVMGDRSKGATAEAFNSKTLGFLTQFQLETNNQWQYMIHDTKMEFQENLAKDGGLKAGATVLFQVGQLAAYSYLFNEMFEQLTGSRAAFDILDIIKKLFGLDDDDKDKDFEERMQEAASELVDALPFASLFGSGGRLPIGEMLTPFQTFYDVVVGNTNKYGQKTTWKDFGKDVKETIPYYVLPTGYGQIKKTAQGLGMYANEVPGSYTDSGNLRFTADTDTGSVIKNALFGQWSGEEAKKYRESGYKTIRANDIQEMQDLGMKSSEYREYKNDLKEAGSKNADKLNYIDSLNIPIEQKNIMASNVVDRPVDMSNYTTFEEFDFAYKNPGKYQAMKAIANDYQSYQTYISGIEDIRDKYSQAKGYSTEQRKKKVVNYVNSLNLTIPQKAMLLRQYYSSYKRYNKEIVNYVNSLDIEYQEKIEILQSLKMKVDSNGNVSW